MKKIGKHIKSPGSRRREASYRAAAIVDDAIDFYGAKLTVKVHHSYPSRLLGGAVDIAGGRCVQLEEAGVEVWIDEHLVEVTLRPRRRRRGEPVEKPAYGGFAGELSKTLLRKFPVAFRFRDDESLEGVVVFREGPRDAEAPKARRQRRVSDGRKRAAKAKDEMRKEYDFSKGVRGKYAQRLKQGSKRVKR